MASVRVTLTTLSKVLTATTTSALNISFPLTSVIYVPASSRRSALGKLAPNAHKAHDSHLSCPSSVD